MAYHRSILLSAASLAALSMGPGPAGAAECRPVTQEAGFDLLIEVEGMPGEFRLVCESGRLLAVPLAAGASGTAADGLAGEPLGSSIAAAAEARNAAEPDEASRTAEADAVEAIDRSAEEAVEESSIELGDVPEDLRSPEDGSAGDPAVSAATATGGSAAEEAINRSAKEAVEELDARRELPAGSAPEVASSGAAPGQPASQADDQTARNAAGVAGQKPAATIAEAASPSAADSAETAPVMGAAADPDASKPGVSAADASPAGASGGAGENKDENRIASTGTREMVPVPVVVIANARLALPGVSFKSVALSGEGDARIYTLSGEADSGRDAAVEVDPSGKILEVDRQVAADEVPEAISRIALALVPEAKIDRVMLSNRENYRTFFVFSGRDGAGDPFELEIRSDGRSVQFLRNS